MFYGIRISTDGKEAKIMNPIMRAKKLKLIESKVQRISI